LDTLSGLTVVGDVSKADFEKRFDLMFPSRSDIYKIVVIYDLEAKKVIGTGTLLLELKFIRNLGTCGHIEDIVISTGYRGKNFGFRIVDLLRKIAVHNDCYKVILDCDDKNVGFYEKCDFVNKGTFMAWYRPESTGNVISTEKASATVADTTAETPASSFTTEVRASFISDKLRET